MIRIALCDDNKEDMLQLHQKIIEWYRENSKNQSVSITEYSDSVYNISKVVSKISRPTKGRLLCYSIFGGNFG